MSSSKSAQKQARVSEKRRERNRSSESRVKTAITSAEKAIATGDLASARPAVKAAMISLDKAAEKSVIHGNNAARRKSRLMKKLNQAEAKAFAENGQEAAE